MKTAIILFPGTNRERDVARALMRAGAPPPQLVWHGETTLPPVDLVVLPGGFAHGDHLRAGAIAARSPVMAAVRAHAGRGGLVLGICNGFQVLTEARLLPGALIPNVCLTFVCRQVHLRVETADSPFTRALVPGAVLRVPVAHHDGNFVCDAETLQRLEGEGRVALRYVTPEAERVESASPNGSVAGIAGILDEGRRVLGLMPHAEDAIGDAFAGEGGGDDGLGLFRSLLA